VTGISLPDLRLCFEGAVPAVIATADADGVPNITYLSRVTMVDGERVALSNQFFSKTARNLAENPRASVLLIDPLTYEQYRLTLVYERTDRRGLIFERLREDVDALAAVVGMQDVFKLRAADVYRVAHIEQVVGAEPVADPRAANGSQPASFGPERLGELTARLSRCTDLDAIVSTTVNGIAELLDVGHSILLLLDEQGQRLYTIASHGYPAEGVGSEVAVGEGIIGIAAERAVPIRVGNVRQSVKYGMSVRRAYESQGDINPGWEIEVPGLARAESQLAVPAIALGQVVGVLLVESHRPVRFTEADQANLSVLASVVANAIEAERLRERSEEPGPAAGAAAARTIEATTHVRFFAVDGSTFLGGEYLIKGVAGRILWSLLGHYDREQRTEFTNKEVRLDPSLELPEFRDNLDSRLLLLKRRLDEQQAPIRIEKTGRGRFRLVVETRLRLDDVAAPNV
jgi:predicted pyridoxine 5'-phosphate oxidase superfamily flavin-nucleotide-binding protein